MPFVTPEEYLAAERASDTKHYYVNGEVYAMAGSSSAHNLIASNLVRELGTRLKRKRCRVYPGDMRLLISETGLYTYPDTMVVCEQPRFADAEVDTLTNPKVVFGVLSKSTEADDRGWKWAHYRLLDTLCEYVMVSQREHRVEQFIRQPDGSWLFREYRSLGDSLRLPSIGCEIPLEEIYYLVEPGGEEGLPPGP